MIRAVRPSKLVKKRQPNGLVLPNWNIESCLEASSGTSHRVLAMEVCDARFELLVSRLSGALMRRSIHAGDRAFDRFGGIDREELELAKFVGPLVTVPAICKIDSGILR